MLNTQHITYYSHDDLSINYIFLRIIYVSLRKSLYFKLPLNYYLIKSFLDYRQFYKYTK